MATVLAKKVGMDMNENYDGEILDKEMMQMLQDALLRRRSCICCMYGTDKRSCDKGIWIRRRLEIYQGTARDKGA